MAAKEAEALLVIPEKASSFRIHPDKLCQDQCFYCGGKFGLFDTPCHVAGIKSLERQRKILESKFFCIFFNLFTLIYHVIYPTQTRKNSLSIIVCATPASDTSTGVPTVPCTKSEHRKSYRQPRPSTAKCIRNQWLVHQRQTVAMKPLTHLPTHRRLKSKTRQSFHARHTFVTLPAVMPFRRIQSVANGSSR